MMIVLLMPLLLVYLFICSHLKVVILLFILDMGFSPLPYVGLWLVGCFCCCHT